MNEDTVNFSSSASGGYLSLVIHIWIGDDGEIIRGTIEDVHTGAQLAMDFSALIALLRQSLVSAGILNPPREEHRKVKPEEGPSDDDPSGV